VTHPCAPQFDLRKVGLKVGDQIEPAVVSAKMLWLIVSSCGWARLFSKQSPRGVYKHASDLAAISPSNGIQVGESVSASGRITVRIPHSFMGGIGRGGVRAGKYIRTSEARLKLIYYPLSWARTPRNKCSYLSLSAKSAVLPTYIRRIVRSSCVRGPCSGHTRVTDATRGNTNPTPRTSSPCRRPPQVLPTPPIASGKMRITFFSLFSPFVHIFCHFLTYF